MTVFNRELEAIRSTCTPANLADAIAALDLARIPPHLRQSAILHRIAEVVAATTTSPAERAKPAFAALQAAYFKTRTHQATGIIL